jgi:hypothetical protein
MIDSCFNPACRRELHYLRDGRVVRVIRGKEEDLSVEHYWLCGPCYETNDFVFSPDGAVSLGVKSRGAYADEFHFRDVLLPERRSARR